MKIKIEMDWGEMLAVFRAFQIAHPPINDDGTTSPTIPLSDSEKTKVEGVADRLAARAALRLIRAERRPPTVRDHAIVLDDVTPTFWLSYRKPLVPVNAAWWAPEDFLRDHPPHERLSSIPTDKWALDFGTDARGRWIRVLGLEVWGSWWRW